LLDKMITTRNQKNVAAAIAGTVARSLVSQIATKSANVLGSYLNGDGRGANQSHASVRGGAIQRITSSAVPRTRKRSKAAKGRRNRNTERVNRGVVTPHDRIRVTLREVVGIANTGAGVYDQYFQFANDYTAGHDFGTFLPRARTLAGAFRFCRVMKAGFTFQPILAYSATGYMTLGVDPSPNAGAPGGIGNVFRHDPSIMGDVKDAHSLVWTPQDDMENQDKLTTTLAGAIAPEHICSAVFQLYSVNGEAAAATIGYLAYEFDIEFFGLV
jgi:hypothetical protein